MVGEIKVDPSVGGAAVIKVGDKCYQLVGPSDEDPNVSSVDGSFADCDDCTSNYCIYVWTGEYTSCDLTTFNIVSTNYGCGDSSSLASYQSSGPARTWNFIGAGSGGGCAFQWFDFIKDNTGCPGGTCPEYAASGAPGAPTGPGTTEPNAYFYPGCIEICPKSCEDWMAAISSIYGTLSVTVGGLVGCGDTDGFPGGCNPPVNGSYLATYSPGGGFYANDWNSRFDQPEGCEGPFTNNGSVDVFCSGIDPTTQLPIWGCNIAWTFAGGGGGRNVLGFFGPSATPQGTYTAIYCSYCGGAADCPPDASGISIMVA